MTQRDHARTVQRDGELRCRMVESTLSTASRLLLRVITVATKAFHEAASCCRSMRFKARLHTSIRRSASLATTSLVLDICWSIEQRWASA